MALRSYSLGQKRVDTCRWTAIKVIHAQETAQTLYISIFWLPISCTLRLLEIKDDYNFDKTMFAPLKETEVKKAFSCFNVSFVRRISLTFRTIWLMVSVSIVFRSTK